MAKNESINVRVSLEEKNNLGARARSAGLFTISDYVRQVLFTQDKGLDLQEGLAEAVKEMKAQGETMKEELQAARETIEAGVLKMDQAGRAGNAEIMQAMETILKKCQDAGKDRKQEQGEKYAADPLLFPCGLCIAFMLGVIFF